MSQNCAILRKMDLNEKIDPPCVRTRSWGFVGYVQDYGPKSEERAVSIGVYSHYDIGRANANAWMQSTPTAVRWEAQPLYRELGETEA